MSLEICLHCNGADSGFPSCRGPSSRVFSRSQCEGTGHCSFTYDESRERDDEVISGGAAVREDGGFISDGWQFASKQELRTAPKAFLSGLDMLLLQSDQLPRV